MSTLPFRWVFVCAESVLAAAATAGALQLASGSFTPPRSDLDALGLSSWVLPGVWLFVSVAVPSGTAAWLAARRSPATPTAVLVASSLLAVELLVQIPFVGPSGLQAVMGTAALALGGLSVYCRRHGWDRTDSGA